MGSPCPCGPPLLNTVVNTIWLTKWTAICTFFVRETKDSPLSLPSSFAILLRGCKVAGQLLRHLSAELLQLADHVPEDCIQQGTPSTHLNILSAFQMWAKFKAHTIGRGKKDKNRNMLSSFSFPFSFSLFPFFLFLFFFIFSFFPLSLSFFLSLSLLLSFSPSFSLS